MLKNPSNPRGTLRGALPGLQSRLSPSLNPCRRPSDPAVPTHAGGPITQKSARLWPPCHRAATLGWHGTSSCTSRFDPFPRAFQVAGWTRKSLRFDSCAISSRRRRQPERAHLAPGADSCSLPPCNDLPSPRPSLTIPRGHGWKGPTRDPRIAKEGDSSHELWLASRAMQGHGGELLASKTHALVSHRPQQRRGAGDVLPSQFGLFLITFTRLRCRNASAWRHVQLYLCLDLGSRT